MHKIRNMKDVAEKCWLEDDDIVPYFLILIQVFSVWATTASLVSLIISRSGRMGPNIDSIDYNSGIGIGSILAW